MVSSQTRQCPISGVVEAVFSQSSQCPISGVVEVVYSQTTQCPISGVVDGCLVRPDIVLSQVWWRLCLVSVLSLVWCRGV